MIAYLKGIVLLCFENYLVLNVNNVGYRIHCLTEDKIEGEEKEFYIHTSVRENDISLYGFENRKDLDLFTKLLTVNGIGPKAAMRLVSKLGGNLIINAVLNNKPNDLKTSGIGMKTASKIVLELKSKFERANYKTDDVGENLTGEDELDDVRHALFTLGYTVREVTRAMVGLKSEGKNLSELIKQALDNLKNLKI